MAGFDLNTAKSLYKTYLGRDVSDEEAMGWKDYSGSNFEEDFKKAAANEISNSPWNAPYSSINPQGYTTMKPGDMESWITKMYEQKMPDIESGIRSSAAGGGLDTGGYMTSLAKAKTAGWTDMLSALMGYKQGQETTNWQKNEAVANRSWQSELADRGYAAQSAQLAANQPGTWDYMLQGASAGSIFGPWGAAIGGLLGYGKKQGLFG